MSSSSSTTSSAAGMSQALVKGVSAAELDAAVARGKRQKNSLLDEEDEDYEEENNAQAKQMVLASSVTAVGPSANASAAAAAAAAATASSTPPLLSSFLALSWPASAYCGSWATDPANLYGINSSKRTRKAGEGGTAAAGGGGAGGAGGGAAAGGGGGGGGEDAKAGGAASGSGSSGSAKDDALEVLSLAEGTEVILSHLSNLCNHVTQKASLQALRAMKAAPHHAHLFTQPLLLFETFKLLACYSFKLPARRFLFFDLFANVSFNMHTITQFDEPFHAQNVSSYAKQKAREMQQANAATAS